LIHFQSLQTLPSGEGQDAGQFRQRRFVEIYYPEMMMTGRIREEI